MNLNPRVNRRPLEEGYALLTLTIFVLIITIAGIAFFGMSSSETRGALYRQSSSEAFYLADGAIERARAKFLDDQTWRDGWTDQPNPHPGGRGTYDLTVRDTVIAGVENPVQLVATGRVGQAVRKIEVIADLPSTAWGVGMLIAGDAYVTGNLCLDGYAHINGEAGGQNPTQDPHFVCDSEYTEGFEITPPWMYTDPDHFPGATYYYVRGTVIDGNLQARIYNALGEDITDSIGDNLENVTTLDNDGNYVFTFDSPVLIDRYFDDESGVFKRTPGDVAVVVNFGEAPLTDPNGAANLVIDGGGSSVIHATLIDARFTGSHDSLRVEPEHWMGGTFSLKQALLEPFYGVAMVAYDFDKPGAAQAQVGSETWPALMYVTRNVVQVNSNFTLVGCLVCLGDWHSNGNVDITYDERFLEFLPEYLEEEFQGGVSSTLEVLRWREIASFTD